MANARSAWRAEFGRLAALGGPLILSRIGSILLVTVDSIMVGRIGAKPLGAVALGNAVSWVAILFGWVSISPVRAMVARALGAGKPEEAGRAYRHGLWLSLLFSVPICAVLFDVAPVMHLLSTVKIPGLTGAADPDVAAHAVAYARILGVGIPFYYAYGASQEALIGTSRGRPVVAIMLIANVVNFVGDWLLIYGHLGFRPMEVEGCAWSTTITRIAMLAAAILYIQLKPEVRKVLPMRGIFRVEGAVLKQLSDTGLPAGIRASFAYGIFTVAAALMSRIGTSALAAHQVAVNLLFLCSVSVASALGSATSVGLGRASGAGDRVGAFRSVIAGYAVAAAFCGCVAVLFLSFPGVLLRLYLNDAEAVLRGIPLVRLAGVFQFFDVMSTVTLGALLGLLDTKRPSLIATSGQWLVSIPVGYFAAFHLDLGAPGLWFGFVVGELVINSLLLRRLWRKLVAGGAPSWDQLFASSGAPGAAGAQG